MDKLIDEIIELILDDMDCHHEVDHEEDGTHMSVDYSLNNEAKLRDKLEALLKPGVTEDWIEKKANKLYDGIGYLMNLSPPDARKQAKDFIRSLAEEMPMIYNGWLPTVENINALPEPVRNYIADIGTNADPPSMVADNIIMKDTIKTLEKILEELPEITDTWADGKAKEIKALIVNAQDEDLSDPVMSLHYLGLSLDIVTSIINDLRPRKAK